MKCAPIIIPTLNRVSHLKRCIDSLSVSKYASETDLFISVDFPPTEKYIEGYEKVKRYLEESTLPFKNVKVFYQKENLGTIKNMEYLKSVVSEVSNEFIFTEDDNEFSQNFLEYVNKGLEEFASNRSVIAVCGFKDTSWIDDGNNVIASKIFPAYGYGMWFDKERALVQGIEQVLLCKDTFKLSNMVRFYKRNKCLFALYIKQVVLSNERPYWDGESLALCDTNVSIYLHLSEHVCIVPTVGKSRTWGNDGSGVNMSVIEGLNPEKKWPLDQADEFVYETKDNAVVWSDENYHIGNKYMNLPHMSRVVFLAWVEYFLFMLCGYNREKTMKIVKKVRGIFKK